MSLTQQGIRILCGLFLVLTGAACASSGEAPRSPFRTVDGTEYFTVEYSAPLSGDPQFTKKLAFLAASTALSRSIATRAYSRLSRTDSAEVDDLLSRRGAARPDVEGAVDMVDEITSSVPLRDVHELRYHVDQDEAVIMLGIPELTYREIVDGKMEVLEEELEQVDLSSRER